MERATNKPMTNPIKSDLFMESPHALVILLILIGIWTVGDGSDIPLQL